MDFHITGAADWPMFRFMMSLLIGLLSVFWVALVGLLVFIHQDLKKQFTERRKEAYDSCNRCSNANINEHLNFWKEINRLKERT